MDRVFHFGSPAVCVSAFTYAGREFKPGESFPYQAMKLDRHTMLGLWFNGMVNLDRVQPAKPGTLVTPLAPPTTDQPKPDRKHKFRR